MMIWQFSTVCQLYQDNGGVMYYSKGFLQSSILDLDLERILIIFCGISIHNPMFQLEILTS